MGIQNRFNPRLAVTLASLPLLSALLGGCELSSEDQKAINDALTYQNTPTAPQPVASVEPECFVQRAVQPPAIITTKLDLLFVADTSASLVDERAAIADGIDAFLANLPSEVNTSVGVLLAHGPKSSLHGKLYQGASEPVVLNSKSLSKDQLRSGMRDKLTKVKNDVNADGGEAMLWATLDILKTDNLVKAKSQGFFRDEAALVVVYVTDENDLCAIYPEGVTRVKDVDGALEANFFKANCSGITPEAVLSGLKALKGDKPLVISGIVYNDQNYPAGVENEYAYGIMDLIELNSKFSVNLATGRYDEGLGEIGNLASYSLRLISDFILSQPAEKIDIPTVRVQVDSKDADFEYRSAVNTVHIEEPGQALSTVDIRYCLKRDNSTCQEGGNCDIIGI